MPADPQPYRGRIGGNRQLFLPMTVFMTKTSYDITKLLRIMFGRYTLRHYTIAFVNRQQPVKFAIKMKEKLKRNQRHLQQILERLHVRILLTENGIPSSTEAFSVPPYIE